MNVIASTDRGFQTDSRDRSAVDRAFGEYVVVWLWGDRNEDIAGVDPRYNEESIRVLEAEAAIPRSDLSTFVLERTSPLITNPNPVKLHNPGVGLFDQRPELALPID